MAKNTLFWDVMSDVRHLAQSLDAGSVSLGSSDTVLGLMAPVTQEGCEVLNTLKERAEKPYIVLAKNSDVVARYAMLPDAGPLRDVIEASWPGPLTVIVKKKPGALPFIQSSNNTVAFRVPGHVGLQRLLALVETIFSTSANKAGQPVPVTFADVHPEILAAVAFVVKDREAHETVVPSTIIDCSQGELKLIREGAIPFSQLKNKVQNFRSS